MTAGQMLLDAAAKAGLYGLMTRSSGPQIRGGEAAAYIRLSTEPVDCPDDFFDVLFCFDWMNVDRFAAELPLRSDSVIIGDEGAKNPPEMITESIARQVMVPLSAKAKEVEGGRPNMVGLGILGELAGIPFDALSAILEKTLKRKGQAALDASIKV